MMIGNEPATRENINKAYGENWAGVNRLIKKHGKDNVYFIRLQKGRVFRKEVPRTTWAFDWAIADIIPRERKRIAKLVLAFRESPSMKAIEHIDSAIDHYDHVKGIWI